MSNIQSRILKHRIDIYAEKETVNALSESEKSYEYTFNDRAQALYVSGGEKMAGQMSYADKIMKFKVRHHTSRYNERQFVKWESEYYNIRSIDPDTDRRYMVLTAQRAPTDTINVVELLYTIYDTTIINDFDKILNPA